VLDTPLLTLHAPPPDIEDPTGTTQTGITAWQFPEWFITQDARALAGGTTRTRRLVHRQALTNSRFIDEDRRPQPVVPIRFVRACIRGHIGDINWRQFVHVEDKPCAVPILWLDERGTSGDLSEVWVRCECGPEPPDRRGHEDRAEAPGDLRWREAMARQIRGRSLRAAEPPPGPHGQQRLLLADDERHLPPR